MTEPVKAPEPVRHTLVLYTDGGARNGNPGCAGWGVHGYLCVPKVSKKGAGHPTHVPTNLGYIRKAELPKVEGAHEVDLIHYVDEVGSFPEIATSPKAELQATTRGFEIAVDLIRQGTDIERLFVQSDSEYVVHGLTRYVTSWMRSNWTRPDGTKIKNYELWIKLVELRSELESAGVQWDMQWVRGHNGEPGNERTDLFATTGVFIAFGPEAGRIDSEFVSPDGYWKADTERHPMLSMPVMFFNTDGIKESKGTYLLTNTRLTDDQHGVRDGSIGYAIVKLDEPDEVVEIIRTRSGEVSDKYGRPGIMQLALADAFDGKQNAIIKKYGSQAIKPMNVHKMDLVTSAADRTPVVREMNPPFAVGRVFEALEAMNNVHELSLKGVTNIVTTDVTDVFYETVKVKKGKSEVEQTQLKAEYIVGFPSQLVDVGYNTDGTLQTKSVKLILGTDLPDRNALKRLESLNPKIKVITWAESESCFRYVVLIEATGCVGIWSGYFSNYVFLSPKKD